MSEKSIIVLHLLFYIYVYSISVYPFDNVRYSKLSVLVQKKKERKQFFLAHTQHFHKHLYTIEEIILKN